MKKIIIGTRPSRLAVAQTEIVINKLNKAYPEFKYEVKKISTEGDRRLDTKLSDVKNKGFFIKEIEIALLNGEIDLAVHSFKDLPTNLPEKVTIAAIPSRANPFDTLVSKDNLVIDQLPAGAKLGTGSLRRKSQLLSYRNDLEIVPIRGNVETRIEKIESLDLDGVILAAAGLERLGLEDKISEYLNPNICLPAARQGAIAIETRKNDEIIIDILKKIENKDTAATVKAEHAFLQFLEAGCHAPIGAYAEINKDNIELQGAVGTVDGSKIYSGDITGAREDSVQLGRKLAERLYDQGAKQILAELNEEEV